jgi:hypothetical protein
MFLQKRMLFCVLAALLCGGCAIKPVASFKSGKPIFEPDKYFAGHTHSWGIFETSSGQPTEILHTETQGRITKDGLDFEQELYFERGKKSHRSWSLRRVDAHHYSATGTGIVGAARGEAYGNTLHLDFTLDALPGNPLGHLHMSQWMYLQPDGVTMVNCDTLTKLGIVVAHITEQFKKEER